MAPISRLLNISIVYIYGVGNSDITLVYADLCQWVPVWTWKSCGRPRVTDELALANERQCKCLATDTPWLATHSPGLATNSPWMRLQSKAVVYKPRSWRAMGAPAFCCYSALPSSVKAVEYAVNRPYLVTWISRRCWIEGESKNQLAQSLSRTRVVDHCYITY